MLFRSQNYRKLDAIEAIVGKEAMDKIAQDFVGQHIDVPTISFLNKFLERISEVKL